MIAVGREWVLGGLLISSFVRDALLAFALLLLLRPILWRTGIEKLFANPPLTLLAIYVYLLGIVTGLT